MGYLEFILKGLNSEARDITFLNPYSYVVFRKRVSELEGFRIRIDGELLARLLSLIFGVKVNRQSFDMTSLAPIILTEAVANKSHVVIVGSSQNDVDRFVGKLKERFDGINIVAYRNGFFSDESDLSKFCSELDSIRPQLVVVGMGSGKQENFLRCARSQITGNYVGYTCGGFIHQSANGLDYYPKWVDRMNFRLFFRVLNEKGLIFRHLKYYPLFIIYFLIDYIEFKFQRVVR